MSYWLYKNTNYFYLHFYRPQSKFTKVMFLHLSVSHSVHRGVCIQEGGLNWGGLGRPPPVGLPRSGGLQPGGDLHPGLVGQTPASDTMGYGQWAGGTHLTGMHSCCDICTGYNLGRIMSKSRLNCIDCTHWVPLATSIKMFVTSGCFF